MAGFGGERSRAANSHVLAEKLFAAVRTERKSDVEKYLCLGADPNCMLLNGITPFHLASGCSRSFDFVRMILEYDGDPNVRDVDGVTPLHVATMWGKTKCLRLLCDNGADVTLKDKYGNDLKWFAQENGSKECIALVDELCSLGNTCYNKAKGTRQDQQACKSPSHGICKSDTRKGDDPTSEASISLRSPLHKLCNDSWIAKRRGSKRHRFNSGKSSRENSPSSSPRSTSRSPSVKTCHSPVPVCVSTHTQCCSQNKNCCQCGVEHFACPAYKDVSNFHCMNRYNHGPNFNTQHTCKNIHNVPKPTPIQRCCDCRQTVKTCTPNNINNNIEETPDSTLDTTDKCVGTSILLEERNDNPTPVAGVACQVTMIASDDEDTAQVNNHDPQKSVTDKFPSRRSLGADTGSDTKAKPQETEGVDAKKDHLKHGETSSTNRLESYCNTTLYNSAMTDFLQGCDRFIEADPKGLDVSSPDHCVSFSIEKKNSNTSVMQLAVSDTPCTAGVGDVRSETKTDGGLCSESPVALPPKKPPQVGSGDVIVLSETPKSSGRASICTNMLLATKIPLTPSELLTCYGSASQVHTKASPQCPNDIQQKNCNRTPVEKYGDKIGRSMQTSADLTLSDSTVPIEQNVDSSVGAQCKSSGGGLLDTVRSNEISCLDGKPVEKLSNHRAELSSKQSNGAASVTGINFGGVVDIQSPCADDVFSTSPLADPDTRASRLHSTALSESHDNIRHTNHSMLSVSHIKDEAPDVYMHQDDDGLSWLEQRKPSLFEDRNDLTSKDVEQSSALQLSSAIANTSSESTIVYDWKTFWKGETLPKSAKAKRSKRVPDCSTTSEVGKAGESASKDIENLSDSEIRKRLISLGYTPGPIPACRDGYLKKLQGLTNPQSSDTQLSESSQSTTPRKVPEMPQFSTEMRGIMSGRSLPDSIVADEDLVRRQFETPDPNLKWREGTTKNSFTYLLLDPRATNDLPRAAKNLSELQIFKTFVGAVFYVGKGKQSRPYSHFREALQTNVMHYKLNPSQKIRHIHDIWADGFGVVSLHVFQSVVACEAYTREAAMIEAIGLNHLTNKKRGEFYGVAATWDLRRKRMFGTFLLMKAMKVLLLEGERQIRPPNLKSNNANQWTGCQAPVPVN